MCIEKNLDMLKLILSVQQSKLCRFEFQSFYCCILLGGNIHREENKTLCVQKKTTKQHAEDKH